MTTRPSVNIFIHTAGLFVMTLYLGVVQAQSIGSGRILRGPTSTEIRLSDGRQSSSSLRDGLLQTLGEVTDEQRRTEQLSWLDFRSTERQPGGERLAPALDPDSEEECQRRNARRYTRRLLEEHLDYRLSTGAIRTVYEDIKLSVRAASSLITYSPGQSTSFADGPSARSAAETAPSLKAGIEVGSGIHPVVRLGRDIKIIGDLPDRELMLTYSVDF